jgi:Mrp family chromosome partitioning ATPase
VVAAADKLHRQQFANGLGSLQDVGARVLGVVLNRLSHKQSGAFSYSTMPRRGPGPGTTGSRRAQPGQTRGSGAAPVPANVIRSQTRARHVRLIDSLSVSSPDEDNS